MLRRKEGKDAVLAFALILFAIVGASEAGWLR
jgi:hypothetical protein